MTTFEDLPSKQEDLFISEEAPSTDSKTIDSEIESLEAVEEKIKLCLSYMTQALAEHSSFKFKEFWEGKKRCLELFKQLQTSRLRSQLWTEYSTLSQEAKRLKELKDEQSNFAIEQIDLAIQAIEADLASYASLLLQIKTAQNLTLAETLKEKEAFYHEAQSELHLLSALAARINALRKELIKTDMRLGVKSKLFDRLSSVGDAVFPKRKELVKAVSEAFSRDVLAFCEKCLKEEVRLGAPLLALREEIKILQTLAKELALSSQVFSETRLSLSKCWDRLKEVEKEKKKLLDEKRMALQGVYSEVKELIDAFAKSVLDGKEESALKNEEDAIFAKIKEKDFSRDDFKEFRHAIALAKKPLIEKKAQEEEERKKEARLLEKKKEEEVFAMEGRITALSAVDDYILLQAAVEEASKELKKLVLEEIERDRLERQLNTAIDALATKKLEAFSLGGEKRLEELCDLLEERTQRRIEVKEKLETYRKALGGSSFDFEKAIYFQEAVELEKNALEAIEEQIEKIENRIDELEE